MLTKSALPLELAHALALARSVCRETGKHLDDLQEELATLRTIKVLADEVLESMSRKFSRMYSRYGRPSIPPETLLKSRLLMSLFTVRSDRQFCEQLRYSLLFRWFLDMDMTDEPFDASTFSRNQDRFLVATRTDGRTSKAKRERTTRTRAEPIQRLV